MSDQPAKPSPALAGSAAEIETLRELVHRQDLLLSLQREILDRLTHEVRTPIAAIQNACYLIETYGRENQVQRDKWHGMIKESSDALRQLMAGFVETESLAASARALTRRPENAAEVVRTVIARLPEAARVRLETTPAAAPPRLLDRDPLERAFRALLDNALKFSPPTGSVDVKVDASDTALQITVVDRGCGIPAEETASLFAPFHRASNAEKIPGSGLGLAVARCAAELHAGTIAFETKENEGSTFVLTLHAPCADAP